MYTLSLKITGETSEGDEIDLTLLRCEKCKDSMRTKNKDEPDSNRFCDIVSSKIHQTRRKKGMHTNKVNLEISLIQYGTGAIRDAVQVHFRCTPVKCHKMKSFVRLELLLSNMKGEIVTKPNQSANIYFRTVSIFT